MKADPPEDPPSPSMWDLACKVRTAYEADCANKLGISTITADTDGNMDCADDANADINNDSGSGARSSSHVSSAVQHSAVQCSAVQCSGTSSNAVVQ